MSPSHPAASSTVVGPTQSHSPLALLSSGVTDGAAGSRDVSRYLGAFGKEGLVAAFFPLQTNGEGPVREIVIAVLLHILAFEFPEVLPLLTKLSLLSVE